MSWLSEIPEDAYIDIVDPINDFVDYIVITYAEGIGRFSDILTTLLVWIDSALLSTPWWIIIAVFAALIWKYTRNYILTIVLSISWFLIGLFGLWDLAMQTLSLTILSTMICFILGLPIGLLSSQFPNFRKILIPILDTMQTMPIYVYLIPALMLFGLGKVSAVLATVIYAIPPIIRLVDVGISQVNREYIEAADAFGANKIQRITKVQIPLALPTIMAGVNQTTMLALSMVVIGSLIGARGLGNEVLAGIQRIDIGRGLLAGVAIVIIAITLDRVLQGIGNPKK